MVIDLEWWAWAALSHAVVWLLGFVKGYLAGEMGPRSMSEREYRFED